MIMNNSTRDNQVGLFQSPAKIIASVLPCFIFLYLNGVMLFALLKKPFLAESCRYILFGHLLFGESLQLLLAVLLYIFAVAMVRMLSYICMIFVLLAAITVKMSPLNLAVMSLERYIAICFPLQHADFVTTKKTGMAIAIMWTMASLDSFAQLFLYVRLESKGFTMSGFCSKGNVFHLMIYSTIDKSLTIFYFLFVSLIIIYTYVAIMFVVRSASNNVQNANKACKTVTLHLFQLCLCLCSTVFSMINWRGLWSIDPEMAIHIQYGLFVSLIIFPKCLSPLIYGVRDLTFRRAFKHYLIFGLRSVTKP